MAQVQDQVTREPLYTPPQVGALMGIDQGTVRGYIRMNKLPAIRIDGHWFVSESDLQTFRATYNPNRKPEKKRPYNLQQADVNTLFTLGKWDDGTAEELGAALDIHPGNARKHLCILEAQKLVARIGRRNGNTVWIVTTRGFRHLRSLGLEDQIL